MHPMYLSKTVILLDGRNSHQNSHAGLGRTANNQKKRDDKTDGNANLDTPDNCKEKGEIHECHVDPRSHPVVPPWRDYMLIT